MYQNFITSIQSLINIYIMLLREAAKKVLSPPPLSLVATFFGDFSLEPGHQKNYSFCSCPNL